MTPLELAATVEALGAAVPFGPEIAEALIAAQKAADTKEELEEEIQALNAEIDRLNYDNEEAQAEEIALAGDALSAYLVSIGLPALPVTAEGYAPELRALIEAVHG